MASIDEADRGVSPALDRLLRRLRGVSESGSGWSAKCPAHDDQKASLSVSEGRDARVLIYCHVGCTARAIVEAVGLRLADLFSTPRTRRT
jgi:hypothetical protein